MVALDHTVPTSMAPFMQKTKKKLAMTALFNKMASYTHHNAHDIRDTAPSLTSSELEEEEEEEQEQEQEQEEEQGQQEEEQLLHDTHTCHYPTTSPNYSLTSGPLMCGRSRRSRPSTASSSCSGRSKHHQASSNSISSPSSTAILMWEEPLIHPSDHMRTLLSQLGSSISTSKAAFALMRASSSPCASAENAYGRAEKAMTEELQTLSDLHMRLYSLIQQHDFDMKLQDGSSETSSIESMGPNVGNVERHDVMLKSYEGIISRFHDEIRKKDAVAEALKETLAKSMLKGEKLERRMKALEAKLSPVQLK